MSWQVFLSGAWQNMDAEDVAQLTNHYDNGERLFTILSRGRLYDIDLEGTPWCQRNRDTGKERSLRHEPTTAATTAKKIRDGMLDDEEKEKDMEKQHELIKELVDSKSIVGCTELMDQCIDDDWLGGLDSLPGNVYRIIAFGGLNADKSNGDYTDDEWRRGMHGFKTFQKSSEKLGIFFIFAIQAFVPPAVFFSNLYGVGVEHVLQWDQAEYGPLAGWSADNFAIRLTSVFFIFITAVNTVSSLLDESISWMKIDKMLKFLNVDDGNSWALYLDAFMNMHVAIWTVLSTFMVLVSEDSISDCVFDAFSLTFLFNLDDIGGDLGFFGNDDWPGLQLAWVDQNMYAVADKFTEVEPPEPNPVIEQMFRATAMFLMSMVFVLPMIYLCMFVPVEG
mmetsp:Transcript_22158/g.43198  ORF Transcript_22158/g.43198 Transcript_22158/m.43198 type:complete len:392 (+) Transcript_22158:69-1244(+)